MNTNATWFSETNVPDASTAILVGEVDSQILEKSKLEYQRGILVVSIEETHAQSDSQFLFLDPNSNKERILSSLSEFFLLDSIHPPEVKVSFSIQRIILKSMKILFILHSMKLILFSEQEELEKRQVS